MSTSTAAPQAAIAVVKPQLRAQAGLMQRKCACGAPTSSLTGDCSDCGRKKLVGIQTKLRIGAPGDALEAEADRVADRVMGMAPEASPGLATNPTKVAVQQRANDGVVYASNDTSAVDPVLRSSGQQLDAATRAFFEPRFGHDFSRVRIHTDTLAAQSADAVHARAYTVGNDVVFASGEYAPTSASGRKLLAHELSHVMQQQGSGSLSPMSVLQRKPKDERMGRILSLDEVKKSPTHKRKQELNAQTVARVYRDTEAGIDKQNCPATLEPGRVITILETLPGELWLRIDAAGIKDVGPKERIFVHASFVKEIHAAVVSDAKPVPASPQAEKPGEPAKPPTESEEFRALIESRPAEYKWEGDRANPKTNALINGYLFSKFLWFHAPKFRPRAIDYIERAFKEHHGKNLDVWEYEKKFGGLHSLENRGMTPFFLAARDAMKHFLEYARKARGGGEDERNWNDDIKALMRAEEPIAVLLDSRKPGEMKQFGKLRSMLRLSAPKAFVSGVLEGVKSQLSDADYKLLAEKLADSSMLALPLMPVAAAGTVVGVAKDIKETLEGLYEMATAPLKMAEQMVELIMTLMLDEDGARQVGVAMGEQEGKEIQKLSKENLITFTYKLYEKVGPLVVSAALAFVTGGGAGAARMGLLFEKLLSRSRKASAIVKKIEALLPEKKKPLKSSDVPEQKSDAPKPSDTPKAPDAPKVEVPKARTKKPNFDDALAARKWAKETLKLTDKTLEGMSPGAYKRLGSLPETDLDRIRNLSERTRRYLLGCHSPCDVEGPKIKERLAKHTDAQLELKAKAVEDALGAKPAEVPGGFDEFDLRTLKKKARLDPEAAEALRLRYRKMSDAELSKLARDGDGGAQSVLDSRAPENTGLKKLTKGQGNLSSREVHSMLAKDLKTARRESGVTRTGRTPIDPDKKVEGGTIAVARSNIPGLEGDLVVGRSKAAGGKGNPDSKFAPSPEVTKLDHMRDHAEQEIADQLAAKLHTKKPADLRDKRVWFLVEQEPCPACAHKVGGVLVKLSKSFPDTIFEIKDARSSAILRLRNGVPLE